jgi:FkbH-like protein
MFDFTHTKKHLKQDLSFIAYDTSYIQNITHITPLIWGEHCVECGVPACYKTCTLFSDRGDRRCKRFGNGIEQIEESDGLYSYAVKVECYKWGKLGAVLLPNCLSKKRVLRQNLLFLFLDSAIKWITGVIPIPFFKQFNYYLKEFITRFEGKGINYPDEFLIELSNPGEDYILYIENTSGRDLLYRNKFIVKQGFNRFRIPFHDFLYKDGRRNFLSIIPQNEEQTLYIHTLDFVRTKTAGKATDNKIKCVVWDLDNTLWEGILSEGDVVKLRQDIVRHIEILDNKGVLNSICSKNDYEETYKKLQEFGIAHYFLYPQINWNPKSENIQNIAKLLNIGLDTFMFIDDSEFELAEVASKLDMVKCYNVSDVERAMTGRALQIGISMESRNRRLSYREIEQRNKAEKTFGGNIDDFLRSCEMQLSVSPPVENYFLRYVELINRTNQFNSSGERISSQMLHDMIIDTPHYLCFQLSCVDKFGDYGIIGFCVVNIKDKNQAICEHFVLSCRAARKKIEQSFFEFLIRYFRNTGFDSFAIRCTTTAKNGPLLSVLSDLFFFSKHAIDNNHFILEVSSKADINFINILTINDIISKGQ